MADISGRLAGTITIQKTGEVAQLQKGISPTTGAVTVFGEKKLKKTASSTYTLTLSSEGASTGASLLHVRAFDAVTGAAVNFTWKSPTGATTTMPATSELLLVSQSNSIASIDLIAGAGPNDTEFEITYAGQ